MGIRNTIFFLLLILTIPLINAGVNVEVGTGEGTGRIGVEIETPEIPINFSAQNVNNSNFLGGIDSDGYWQSFNSQEGLTGDKNGSFSLTSTTGLWGLGTETPIEQLTFVSSTSTRGIGLYRYSNDVVASRIRMNKARGTEASPNPISVSNNMLDLVGRGYDGSGFEDGARIRMTATETWDANNQGTEITFSLQRTGTNSIITPVKIDGEGDLVVAFDTFNLAIGSGKDLKLHHDGTDSFINNTNGDLVLTNVLGTGNITIPKKVNSINLILEGSGSTQGSHIEWWENSGSSGSIFTFHSRDVGWVIDNAEQAGSTDRGIFFFSIDDNDMGIDVDGGRFLSGELQDLGIGFNGSDGIYEILIGTGDHYFLGGNVIVNNRVGIGNNAPAVSLEVGDATKEEIIRASSGVNGNAILSANSFSSTGNPLTQYIVAGGNNWVTGVDNADSDKYKISSHITDLGTNTRLTIDGTGKVGIGKDSPDSIFHIKADIAGSVGSHSAGQIIIQNPADTVFANAVITGYESDADGNPDQQLWYLGSSSSSNSNIILLNRRNALLQFGTSSTTRMTILGNGNVGIGTTSPTHTLNVVGDLNVTGIGIFGGNITSENVFIKQYIFPHTNATMTLTGASVWQNITFDQEVTDIKKGITHTHSDATNTTFTITRAGIYNIDFNFDLIDTSVSASDIDTAGRLVYVNGTEIIGSNFETDITKQNIEVELSHSFLVRFQIGDAVKFQFIADDADVEISTHGTFGDHKDSATISINKIANLDPV